jgi:hypothetical protein
MSPCRTVALEVFKECCCAGRCYWHKLPIRDVRYPVAIGGKAEVMQAAHFDRE